MDKDRDKMAERILHLTLEILFRLTGEDYTVVKKTSSERCQDPVSEGWGRPLSPITGPPPHPLIHEDIKEQKILELIYKMIELLTGEVPIRCQDVAVYFSMEEWEYLEGHKDLYKDVMMEDPQPLTSPVLSSERTTSERCPRPLLPQDCKQEDPDVLLDHEGPDAASRPTGPGTSSQSRVRARRGGVPGPSSSRPHVGEEQELEVFIDGDLLISDVQTHTALWNTAHRHHWDSVVTRRLWDEVTRSQVDGWEDLDPNTQRLLREKVMKRWRSIRDRYKRDFNNDMKAPSGSAGRRQRYIYYNALSFLRPTLAIRSTPGSISQPSAEILPVAASKATTTRPPEAMPTAGLSGNSSSSESSQPHAAAGESCQAADIQPEGPSVGFPLSLASDVAHTARPDFLSVCQRQEPLDRNFLPEFVHMSSVFQDSLKYLNEKMAAGFAEVKRSFSEVQRGFREIHNRLDKLKADASKSVNHLFFLTVLRQMENLPSDSQLNIMHACQQSLSHEIKQHPPTQPYQTPAPPYPQPSQPCQAPAQPCQAPAQPCQAPAQPCQAPAQPCQASAQPCQASAQPCQIPSQAFHPPSQQDSAPSQRYPGPSHQYTYPFLQHSAPSQAQTQPSQQRSQTETQCPPYDPFSASTCASPAFLRSPHFHTTSPQPPSTKRYDYSHSFFSDIRNIISTPSHVASSLSAPGPPLHTPTTREVSLANLTVDPMSPTTLPASDSSSTPTRHHCFTSL
ncbi:uncharacterized protein ACNLHF_021726 isoform 2-T2 [Anomaloglossus baeobatrachus]